MFDPLLQDIDGIPNLVKPFLRLSKLRFIVEDLDFQLSDGCFTGLHSRHPRHLTLMDPLHLLFLALNFPGKIGTGLKGQRGFRFPDRSLQGFVLLGLFCLSGYGIELALDLPNDVVDTQHILLGLLQFAKRGFFAAFIL